MSGSPSRLHLEAADRLHSATIHLLRHARKRDTLAGQGPARLSALSVLVFGGPMALGEPDRVGFAAFWARENRGRPARRAPHTRHRHRQGEAPSTAG
jgi:hypothetical protein